jgi:hypothetical protein
MKRFTALILFIIILFISMAIFGIYIKNKFTQNTVTVLDINIEIYKYKYGKDEKDNYPYKTIALSKDSQLKEFTDALNKIAEISADESNTLKSNNCVIKINYQKSTQNDLYTNVYDAWYDETNQAPLILRKDGQYYELPLESSKIIYRIVNEN